MTTLNTPDSLAPEPQGTARSEQLKLAGSAAATGMMIIGCAMLGVWLVSTGADLCGWIGEQLDASVAAVRQWLTMRTL